jgi:hypothetical protein
MKNLNSTYVAEILTKHDCGRAMAFNNVEIMKVALTICKPTALLTKHLRYIP